ncbi:MAG TPA: hypothetical protein VGN90_13875 [Pyrinomonadaceae bacterium]|nr:hypothetical protein [Pyrinomonadaceae bacterium]
MLKTRLFCGGLLVSLTILGGTFTAFGQTNEEVQFGPVVRAYLGYLRNEQEVVDDRASRREVTPQYYRKNSNRIRALRQMAVQIALETQNDYLPELEAVTGDEFGLLFEHPPRSQSLRVGEVVQTTFRYLGVARSGDLFYVFARLDPYEQAELVQKLSHNGENAVAAPVSNPVLGTKIGTRSRRVSTP